MEYTIVEMNQSEIEQIEDRLDRYDQNHIHDKIDGRISLGVKAGERLIAGADACFTAFHILYVSTVFVDKDYRRRGVGRALLNELENRAARSGARIIRLDTFNWQGREFYQALGYQEVGKYTDETDGFSEYFFIKRL
jgi:ribosomal protein S18 acetylase RimI-like enzyme